MAFALQALLLLEGGNHAVSDAFITSRLEKQGRGYGTLPRGLDIDALLVHTAPMIHRSSQVYPRPLRLAIRLPA